MKENGTIPHHDNLGGNDSIDVIKLRSVLNRNWFWIILILAATNLAGYLFIRYTKPMFESSSELKLDIKREATSLGLVQYQDVYNLENLSGEIELINSRLFFSKVIETADIEVQYFTYGNILDDEKYRHTPFTVDYDIKNTWFYNKPFDISFLDEETFEINGPEGIFSGQYRIGEKLESENIDITVQKTAFFGGELLEENYYFLINSHEALIDYLENNITVEPLNLNAHTIKITFQDHNRYKAHDLVTAIDTLYLNYSNMQKNQANQNKIEYLNEQLSETETVLEAYEDYFENFTIDNKTVDLDEDVKKTLSFMNQLDSQRYELRARITHVEEISEIILTDQLENININRTYFPQYILEAITHYDELYYEQKRLGLSYKENTFAYERKNNELELLKGGLVTDLNQYKLNLYETLTDLNNRKKELEANLLKLPSKGTEFNKAKRFYALYEEMYLSLMKSKNEFEIARAGTIPDFRILSPATLPTTPISPRKLIVYGVGIITGFILSFLFIGVNYLVSNKVTSTNEIENLTVAPIVGTLPYENSANGEARLLVFGKPKSAISEAFRSIRTNLDFMIPGQSKKIISVSSTVSGEGKTFVTLNLGGVIAMSNQRVIILDLDLRKPKIHRNFGHKELPRGISTILIKKHSVHECIQKTDLDQMDYIPAGPIPPNPSELLLNGVFDEMIKGLKEEYDVVILDTPPIGLVTDAIMAMKKADLKLFVVRADYSHRSYLNAVNRLIKVNKFTNIALVINALKSIQGHGYGYGYGYGYGGAYYEETNNGTWIKSIRKKIRV